MVINKKSADDSGVYHGMASKTAAPPSLLTTSRRLIDQLELFEKDMVQNKDHHIARQLSCDFAAIKQAMLDVKNSQDKVTIGLEESEPISLLSHQLPEEFLAEDPPKTCYRIVPSQSADTVGVPYVHPDDGHLSPRDPNSSPTLKAARDHLLWKHSPTPLTSVFDDKQHALDWAVMLQARHEEIQFVLVEIDSSSLRSRFLYDATKIVKYLDLPGFRVNYHRGEYFWLGTIDSRYIAKISPTARGTRLEQASDPDMVDGFELMN